MPTDGRQNVLMTLMYCVPIPVHRAAVAEGAKPRGAEPQPAVAAQQREALEALEARLPCLVERERFRFDAAYFA